MLPRSVSSEWPASVRVERPILHPEAALALRRARVDAAVRPEVLERTARFLARLEDAPFVTRGHVEAAAAIATGNDLGDAAALLDAEDAEDEAPAVKAALPRHDARLPVSMAPPGSHGPAIALSLLAAALVVGGAAWCIHG